MRRYLVLFAVAASAALAGCSSSGTASSPPPSTPPASNTVSQTPSAAPTASGTVTDVAINLRDLATAEETYFTDTGKYTTDSGALASDGFTRSPGTASEALLAGVDPKKGYCLVGGVTTAGPWIIWDNEIRGGFVHKEFRGSSAAEAACSDARITGYSAIS